MPPRIDHGDKVATHPDILTPDGVADWMDDVLAALKSTGQVVGLSVQRAVDDYVQQANLVIGTPLQLPITTAAPWTCRGLVAVIPTGATATLQVKDRTIPIVAAAPSPFLLSPIAFQMDPHDLIQITIAGAAGFTFLSAWGHENGPLR